jgi:uncharacterized repeat protein (TIGR03803 family)
VRLNLLKNICILFATCIATVTGSIAQSSTTATFTTLASFNGTNGGDPFQTLVQGTDGNLYGFAAGSAKSPAEVFKVTLAGTIIPLVTSEDLFQGDPGPLLSVLGADGNFYGTTMVGGTQNGGTVFQMTPDGQLTTLYNFCETPLPCSSGGAYPMNGVIQGSDGNFYGTTPTESPSSFGAIFQLTLGGVLTTLYGFNEAEFGGYRSDGPLIEGTNGNFFGLDSNGNIAFTVTPQGEFAILHNFCCANGGYPVGPLVQTTDGNLYGEALAGGLSNRMECGVIGCGTIFRMTPEGWFRTIYSFCAGEHSCPSGSWPTGGLTLGSDGNLYGITLNGGGPYRLGTIFRVTPNGALTTLHHFVTTDGYGPSGLVQATNGMFYGAMAGSASSCCGSIYSLSVGLPPFVKTVPTIGSVGGAVIILGNDLTGTSSVAFNGIPAAYTVVSDTEITATVPDGATTGSVEVTTSNGTLKSNLPFQVGFASTSGFGGPGWNADQNLP